MEIARWWEIVGGALDDGGEPRPEVVLARLRQLPPEDILAFERHYAEHLRQSYLHPLWAAAYLIEGGCGDDGFRDFRAGLILQGRAAFEQAVADPDALADLPIVRRMADDEGWLGCEGLHYVARQAYGDPEAFDAALGELRRGPAPAGGERWDVEDEDANRRHLPRLAAMFQDV
ncbi:DUF4240 domain-containing protein [Dactylosporangium sp. CS-033363]|uniref:DUF4240 domain-containing protein n=1 Tax=Dactylosporangium sp. CS-033363 TaxID=3239935 RepID=UPI003D8A4EBA